MGMDTTGLAFPKGPLQIEDRKAKKLDDATRERICREEVWRLFGHKCNVPGCRERAVHQHHIVYRSKSRALKFDPRNRAPLCQTHHDLEHAGKITIHPRTSEGELIVTGAKQYLAFKL